MAVQEEINHKQVVLMMKSSKITWTMILKGIKAYKQHQTNRKINPHISQEKMTVQELAKKGQEMTTASAQSASQSFRP